MHKIDSREQSKIDRQEIYLWIDASILEIGVLLERNWTICEDTFNDAQHINLAELHAALKGFDQVWIGPSNCDPKIYTSKRIFSDTKARVRMKATGEMLLRQSLITVRDPRVEIICGHCVRHIEIET